MIISLIAAIDRQRGLGKDNQLMWRLPDDLAQFKRLTLGKPLIMGARTFASIGRPLPQRKNIVMTRQSRVPKTGIVWVSDWQSALAACAGAEEVMIIGGAMIYAMTLPFAQRLYLTEVAHTFDADVFFPEVPWSEWRLVDAMPHPADQRHAYDFCFKRYERQDNHVECKVLR